ncbi:RNA polymerase sigma factor [Brevibacillus sp. NRS-1366]|uniref:RNA polymerase sigma factor n=1 Tax=Brevibacillus sp. NRS-1366 TaxID=3233899 RepID=UPI003D1936DA
MDENVIKFIVRSVQAGDYDGYEQLIDHFQNPIYRYCYHLLGHHQEAEDAVQDIFIKTYQNIAKYQQNGTFSAWLYKIAYYHCLNLIKRRKLVQWLPFLFNEEQYTSISPHVPLEEGEFNDAILCALSKLSIEERNVLILRIVEEKSYEQISMILPYKEASLRKKYERAVQKFKKYYSSGKGADISEEEFALFKRTERPL